MVINGNSVRLFKGVVATDKNNGFWLVHSAPRFPNNVADGYDSFPDFASRYGQSFLCLTRYRQHKYCRCSNANGTGACV